VNVRTVALERLLRIDTVARHQDALRLLDHSAAPECALQVVKLREPLQGDVDRALELLRGGVHDVGEDAALGRFEHIRRIADRQERDHRARRLTDDLGDQRQSVLRREP
jgi:hypothetical protein